MKRLALLLDGTWNGVGDNTNLWRLCQLLASSGTDGVEQLSYYTEGVGTARGERIRGGMLGYGLDEDVIGAYRWLMGHYDRGDQIFLFGFSRGAYTARSLAGMIARCGLLRPGSPLSVEELYRRYQLGPDAPSFVELANTPVLPPEGRRLLRHSRRVPVKMIGVFDTVGALGITFGNIAGISRKRFRFHNTRLSTLFEHAYQALAIDEHRAAFRPALWTRFTPDPPDPPDRRRMRPTIVEQRWFVGAHANIGGGYCGDDLPQAPLAWLMGKAGALGLSFRGDVALRGHEIRGPVNDSFAAFLHGCYRIARLNRRHHRPIGADRRKVETGWVEPAGETIDASVFERWRRLPDYRPPNLAAWAAARGLDPARLRSAVDAATGKPVTPPPAPPKRKARRPRAAG